MLAWSRKAGPGAADGPLAKEPARRDSIPAAALAARRLAAEALAGLGPRAASAASALGRCLSDPSAPVRVAASRALRALGSAAAPAMLLLAEAARRHLDAHVRLDVIQALARCGPAASGELVRLLADPEVLTRWLAVDGLRAIGPAMGPPALAALDRSGRLDADPEIRTWAAQALHEAKSGLSP
jgi:HEAT repeat protein